MTQIIKRDKSIVVAMDVDTLQAVRNVADRTRGVEGIGGYKVSAAMALRFGLKTVVDEIKSIVGPEKAVIYDHQKAGTDVPHTGKAYMEVMKHAGVDAAILFPLTGPKVLQEWVRAAIEAKVKLIIGGVMTHPMFKQIDGGWIHQDIINVYAMARSMGVTNFVVPGNQPAVIGEVRRSIDRATGHIDDTLWAPGFIDQGGNISDAAKVAGQKWHAIVGRAIFNAEDMHAAALELTEAL